jgi:hypothetical protein
MYQSSVWNEWMTRLDAGRPKRSAVDPGSKKIQTVQRTRSVRKASLRVCAGQQGNDQSFSPVAEDAPLLGRKSLLHHETFLLYVFSFGKIKLLLFFMLSVYQA